MLWSACSPNAPKVTGGVFKPIILSTGGLANKQRKYATSITPRNLRILRANNRAVRQGKVDLFAAMLKLEKANEQLMARSALLEEELARVKAAHALDKATRGSKKKQRYTEGQLFDLLYQEEHAEELAVRKAEEEEAT
ncbi:hypothetical protein C355_02424 [Cryptococcus neoformans Th84]|nr:hypothetical protein C355_02424 [Cryptococcus neoformans var. grubii Th84]